MTATWSYDPSLAANKDIVRFMIGDTDSDDPQMYDEEIAFLLSAYTTPIRAAVSAARALLAKYARQVDRVVGPLRIYSSQRVTAYRDLLAALEAQALGEATITPYAGGISIADKIANEDDTDRVPPAFTRNMQTMAGDQLTVRPFTQELE